MKTIFMAASLNLGLLLPVFSPVNAMEPMAPVQQQNFLCGPLSTSLMRVSTVADRKCCSPKTHCVEYLSNTVLAHESQTNRT